MDKIKIIKSAGIFTIVSIITKIIAIPKSIIIGLVLMPNEFGLFNSIFLWYNYLTIINIGILTAASRESAHYFGQEGKEKLGVNIQNKAIMVDFLVSAILITVYIIYALRQSTFLLISFHLIVGAIYILYKISSYYERFNSSRNLFTGVAFAHLIENTLGPILIIATIFYFKIYSLFIIPIIALIIKIIYYRIKMPIDFRLDFNFSGIKKYFLAGIFFGLISILSSAYQVVDRTFIKFYLDNTIMGFYSFSMIFVMMMITIFTNLQSVFIDTLNKYSATVEKDKLFVKTAQYINYLLIFALMIIIISQLFYYLLVNYYLVNYQNSDTIFIIFSLVVFFYAIFILPNSMLQSRIMNKERIIALVLFVGIISSIAFNRIFLIFGWEGEGIALGTVLSQAIIAGLGLFYFVKHSAKNYIKHIYDIISLTIFIIAYSSCFYYMAINNYQLWSILLCFIIGFSALIIILKMYYKINIIDLIKNLYNNEYQTEF